jgi:hypothetical protein
MAKDFSWIIPGLAFLYLCTGGNPSGQSVSQKYSLPQEIKVVETDLPSHDVIFPVSVTNELGQVQKQVKLEKIVNTKDIPFDKHFYIKTDRYTLTKNQDWLPSRALGHVFSLPFKLFFFDWDISWGPDGDRARVALSMLENKNHLNNLTVRLNYNEPIYDTFRLFTEPALRERNPFLARATIGLLSTLGGELFAELRRGDYYNPFTHTAVNYSNVESIFAHEVGHAKDFQRFDNDWIYSFARVVPPVMLYQEAQASLNAKNLMSPKDSNQVYRYLLPAFLTYAWATYRIFKRKGKKDE